MIELERIASHCWRIPPTGGMRVEGRIYTSPEMLPGLRGDPCVEQVANVAHLPGIVGASLAMPDIHWGYGFPIGGVAAFDAEEGVVSPGGVGYDINCGVRLLRTDLDRDALAPRLRRLVERLYELIPAGVGAARPDVKLDDAELRRVLGRGARWAVERGMGHAADLDYLEEGGCLRDADPGLVSERAYARGRAQLGTLGSGNHFAEVQYVAEVYDDEAAGALGLRPGQIAVTLHSGSRGLGHQVCTDYLKRMQPVAKRLGIALPDRQLCCAPLASADGRDYLGAMSAAANYAFANRQVMTHFTRRAIDEVFGEGAGAGVGVVYDVCHNIAKFETFEIDGAARRLCVHRKGATRSYPPHHPQTPAAYREVGQPVLIPGDMGRYSYVLVGTPRAFRETFGSTCHGAGRVLSRRQAKRQARGRDLLGELEQRGVTVKAAGMRTVAEEMPEAYKDVAEVVEVVARAGLSRKVAQLRPLGVVKG